MRQKTIESKSYSLAYTAVVPNVSLGHCEGTKC